MEEQRRRNLALCCLLLNRIEASSAVDPIYSSEAYLFRDFGHDQDGVIIEIPKSFSFIFLKEDGKYSEMEFAGMAKPNISNSDSGLRS